MIYVMSDIHGDKEKFKSVMSKINMKAEDKLYVLGDVIDRQPHGIEILLELMGMGNATVLLGNHELMMKEALTGIPNIHKIILWYKNHGEITQRAFMQLKQKTKSQLISYISNMPLSCEININEKKYLLVHGAPPSLYDKVISYPKSKTEFTVRTRLTPDCKMPEGQTVIFGHTPTEYYQVTLPLSIWYGEDKIGIDCGCGHDHPVCRLACLRLDDMTEFYSD